MSDQLTLRDGRQHPQRAKQGVDTLLVVLGVDCDDRPGFMLGDSRLRLGAGADDDVYLTGVGVVPGHLRLFFLEGRMTLLSASEEVRVDGDAITEFPFDLKPLQVVSLGPDTHLAYGPAGSEWPSSPVWETLDAEGQAPTGLATDPLLNEAKAAPSAGRGKRRPQVVHGARLTVLALTVVTVIVTGLLVTDLTWSSSANVVPGEVAIDRSQHILNQLLESNKDSFGSVSLTARNDGALSLTGFIDSEEVYSSLAKQVRQQLVSSGGNVRMDVLTSERLEVLVSDILSRFPLAARIENTPDAILLNVYGVKLEPEKMARVKSDLSRLAPRVFPKTLKIEFNVQDAEKLTRDVMQSLSQSAFTRDLRLELDESGGHIVGTVPAVLERQATAAAISIMKNFEFQVPMTISLKVDSKLNFSVVGLTLGGELPTATLAQRGRAQTFRVGDAVFGVGELVDIRNDGVLLALGKREVFIPISR